MRDTPGPRDRAVGRAGPGHLRAGSRARRRAGRAHDRRWPRPRAGAAGDRAATRWFTSHGIVAVLIRPDRCIFGAVTDVASCATLAAQFNDSVSALTTPV